MPDMSSLGNLAPYHILSYGTLLGTEMFQSFIGGIIAYRVLPRPQFSTLQAALFPIYFSMQTALPAILALTYPGTLSSVGIRTSSGLAGVLAQSNRKSVLIPLTTIFLAGLSNFAIIGPATTKVMKERKHQETRDGKKSYDKGTHSAEMAELNRRFGQLHGASSLVNLVGLLATIWYGAVLSERLS